MTADLRRIGAQHLLREGLIFAEEKIDGRAVLAAPCVVCSFCVVSTKVRNVVTALLEILVTSRALLAIPALLVDGDDGRKNGNLLTRQRDMRNSGNGQVPVLAVDV